MRFSFHARAGFLRKSTLKRMLMNMKMDLQYLYPEATFNIDEDSGWFNSYYTISGEAPDGADHIIQQWYDYIQRSGG